MSGVTLVQAPPEALRKSRNACTSGLVAVRVARYAEAHQAVADGEVERTVEVFDDIADRVRTAARHGAPGFVFMAGRTAADPFAPEAHVQSATFLAMAAALECGVPVRFMTEGLPARGFEPLFKRYRDLVGGQVRFVGPEGSALGALEPHAAGVEARLRGTARLVSALGRSERLAARIDPVVPGINDDAKSLGPVLAAIAETGVTKIVAVPLRLNVAGRERITAAFGSDTLAKVARHYIPGRARRRVAPVPPGERLPLERETSLAWRLRMAFEPGSIDLIICNCRDSRKASCGLGVSHRREVSQVDQRTLWAV